MQKEIISKATLIRASYIAAPVLLFIYGITHWIDGLDGNYGPGIAWTLGHILFLLGMLMFVPIIARLYVRVSGASRSRRFIAGLAATVALIGLLAFIRVAVIDIITGLRAPNPAAMSIISKQLNLYPNTPLTPFFNFGPLLFQLGLLVLMLQLTVLKPRQLPWWSATLLVCGFLLLALNTNFLMPGSILIGVAFLPLAVGKTPQRSPRYP